MYGKSGFISGNPFKYLSPRQMQDKAANKRIRELQNAHRTAGISAYRGVSSDVDMLTALDIAERSATQPQNHNISRPSNFSGEELKCCDTYIANSTTVNTLNSVVYSEPSAGPLTTALYTCVNEVKQGSTVYQRNANRIIVKSIDVRGVVGASYTGAQFTGCNVRVMLVYDRQCNGAAAGIGDIFACSTDGTNPNPHFGSKMNIANKSRFIFLRDEIHTIDPGADTSCDIHIFHKCRLETEYKASAMTIGDIATGALYLLIFTSGSTYNCPSLSMEVRIRYTE